MLAAGIVLMALGVVCTVVFFLGVIDFRYLFSLETLFSFQYIDSILITFSVMFAVIGCALIIASIIRKKRE